VKQITGFSQLSTQLLQSVANQFHDGDLHELASSINQFFQQVAADLQLLDDDSGTALLTVIPDKLAIDPVAVKIKMNCTNINNARQPAELGPA